MGTGKSLFKIAKTVSKDVCTKRAMNRLPLVLLKIQVMTAVKTVAAVINITMLRMVGGKFQAGIQNMGRCQNAQMGPRMRLPKNGPYRRCRRGSANPRHLGSSPSGPPRKNMKTKRGSMGSGAKPGGPRNEAGASGRKTTLTTMIAGRPRSANRYHLKATRHSANWHSKRPTPCVPSVMLVMSNADKNGPTNVAIVMLVYNPNGLRYDRRPAPSSE